MDWRYLLNSFDGRIGRQPFWFAFGALLAAELAAHAAAYRIEGDRLGAIVDLLFTYPEFAVTAKRGHDRDMPTWVVGLFFALSAVLDLITILGWSGTLDERSPLFYLIALPVAAFALVLLIDLGFRRGTHGPNRFGPDPLESRAAPKG